MHDEVVKRRKWLSDSQFMDLVGATNLIPGPNSTELATTWDSCAPDGGG
jgi:chromate transporter